jgi:hypothetical protein
VIIGDRRSVIGDGIGDRRSVIDRQSVVELIG